MSHIFVDSNVFLRLFTDDDPDQQERSARLIEAAAEGALSLVTGPPVLFEVAWTLRVGYKLSKADTLNVLRRIAGAAGVELTDRKLVDDALLLAAATGQEFADAYVAVSARDSEADAIATFNLRHFERLGATLYEF